MSQQLPPDFSPWQPLEGAPQPSRPSKRSGAVTAVALLVLILAIAVILNESLLRIRQVTVSGNRTISAEQVIAYAGLNQSISYFAVNESKIKAGVENCQYLVYEGLEKRFPNSLTLFVREREIKVMVQEMNINYFLDEEGMVLERRNADEKETEDRTGLIVVTGLKPRDMRVGRILTPGTAAHLEAYREVLKELALQGFSDQISELNVTDPENLYLVTTDGYTAHLGDIGDLRAKIGTVRAVVAKLREMGLKGGMLEASIPAEVIYTPENL